MAKNITISVPDELHAKIQKNKEISPSGVCQKALNESLATKNDLAKRGAERLRKEQWNRLDVFRDKCYEAGQEWAADTASLEDLEFAFESQEDSITEPPDTEKNRGVTWLLYSGRFGEETHHLIPDEFAKIDTDNEFFWAFVDGADSMWGEMKALLGRE